MFRSTRLTRAWRATLWIRASRCPPAEDGGGGSSELEELGDDRREPPNLLPREMVKNSRLRKPGTTLVEDPDAAGRPPNGVRITCEFKVPWSRAGRW